MDADCTTGRGTALTLPGACPASMVANVVSVSTLDSVNQLMQHLADDVLPVILRQAFAIPSEI
jgi:hypothetical protein